MSPEELRRWSGRPRRKAGALAHFGIGMWMRNNWGLWHGSELRDFLRNEYLLLDADGMSSLILDCLWSDRNVKPRVGLMRATESAIRLKKEFPNVGSMWP